MIVIVFFERVIELWRWGYLVIYGFGFLLGNIRLCLFLFPFVFVEIFSATSAMRPRADVAYCIHALARRLAKTRNWIVMLLFLLILINYCCFV